MLCLFKGREECLRRHATIDYLLGARWTLLFSLHPCNEIATFLDGRFKVMYAIRCNVADLYVLVAQTSSGNPGIFLGSSLECLCIPSFRWYLGNMLIRVRMRRVFLIRFEFYGHFAVILRQTILNIMIIVPRHMPAHARHTCSVPRQFGRVILQNLFRNFTFEIIYYFKCCMNGSSRPHLNQMLEFSLNYLTTNAYTERQVYSRVFKPAGCLVVINSFDG